MGGLVSVCVGVVFDEGPERVCVLVRWSGGHGSIDRSNLLRVLFLDLAQGRLCFLSLPSQASDLTLAICTKRLVLVGLLPLPFGQSHLHEMLGRWPVTRQIEDRSAAVGQQLAW